MQGLNQRTLTVGGKYHSTVDLLFNGLDLTIQVNLMIIQNEQIS